LNYTREPGAF